MQRHESIIQLSDHVKNKLKQHQHQPIQSSFINSSDEFLDVNSIDEEDDHYESDRSHFTPPTDRSRPRRATYTIYEVQQPLSNVFFTERNIESSHREKYSKDKRCDECHRRNHIIELQKQDLKRLYEQNKLLNHQLRSSILLNRRYENDIEKLKYHLNQVNSHLYDYQISFDDLKQKILSDKKKYSKENQDDEQEHEVEEEEQTTIDHIKRLRYEIQMYNRIVAAKEKEQEKYDRKQNYYLS